RGAAPDHPPAGANNRTLIRCAPGLQSLAKWTIAAFFSKGRTCRRSNASVSGDSCGIGAVSRNHLVMFLVACSKGAKVLDAWRSAAPKHPLAGANNGTLIFWAQDSSLSRSDTTAAFFSKGH